MGRKNSGLNISGIYKITSKVHPERIYIGSANVLRERKEEQERNKKDVA